jgi:hypothetical protein
MNRGSFNRRMATYGNVVQRMVMYGNLWRRRAVYCMAVYCIVVLTACNGCALLQPQPIAVSCHAFSTGHIVSREQQSMGESRGIQKSQYICQLIFTPEELESVLRSSE